MANQPDERCSILNRLPTIVALLLSGLALWFSVALFLDGFKIQSTTDWLQAIASIFSSLAVIVAIYSLKLQQSNFDRQLFDARSAAFNNTLKILYDTHSSALNSIRHGEKNGKECFPLLLESFNTSKLFNSMLPGKDLTKAKSDLKNKFIGSTAFAFTLTFPYLNTMSLMLHIIDEEKSITHQQKKNYIDIIKSQLTEAELIFILYHILLANTEDNNLLNIATEYSLFETIKAEAENCVVQASIKPLSFGLTEWPAETHQSET